MRKRTSLRSDRKDDGTLQEQLRTAVSAWANRLECSRNALFECMPDYGRSTHWLRERYYGRATVAPSDVDWVLAASGMPTLVDIDVNPTTQEFVRMRTAIAAFCLSCDGGTDISQASCWDGTCPLRPVSPLPLRGTKS